MAMPGLDQITRALSSALIWRASELRTSSGI